VGSALDVKRTVDRLAPAFYGTDGDRSAWGDWWLLLHPPYTLWHLSYVAIGACLAPTVDGGRLVATLLAFFLAVGVGAHALDELHSRPLGTHLSAGALVGAAIVGVGGAVALGVVGVHRVGLGLAVFIVVGAVLVCAYNLELFGGRLHGDVLFGLAWGAFPVGTGYYAQASTLRPSTVAAAAAAFFCSMAQRSLSTRARHLRRSVDHVQGTMRLRNGDTVPIDRSTLLDPIEGSLKALAAAMVALAAALVLFRFARA